MTSTLETNLTSAVPRQIRVAVALNGLAVLVALVPVGLPRGPALSGSALSFTIGATVVVVGIWAGISYGLYRGRHWARVLFLLLTALSVIGVLRHITSREPPHPVPWGAWISATSILSTTTSLVAAVLLLTGPANEWFRVSSFRTRAARSEFPGLQSARIWAWTSAAAGMLLFILSLTQHAFRTDADNQLYGIIVLITGPIEIVVEPLLGLPWLANPVLVAVWVAIFVGARRFALAGSALALGLAVLFVVNGKIMESEGGNYAAVIALNTGYYLWTLAMLAALAGALVLNYRKRIAEPD